MADPVVLISHFTVKHGQVDTYRGLAEGVATKLRVDKPRTLAFLSYLANDRTLTIVHVFADAKSMDLHIEGSDERSAAAMPLLVANGWDIYGLPSDAALAVMRKAAAAFGGRLTLHPDYVAGFVR